MHVVPSLLASSLASLNLPLCGSSGGALITVDFDGSVLLQFVIFMLLFLLLKPVLLDPFLKVMQERENRIDGAKKHAREMDAKAGEIVLRYDEQLEKVRKVAAGQREKLRAEALQLEAKILDEARTEAAEVAFAGKETVHQQANEIRRELTHATASLASHVATKVLGRPVNQ